MQLIQRRTALVIALTLPLAACGGGGTSSSGTNATSALVPPVSHTKNGAAFTIRIPKAAQSSSKAARTAVRNTSLSATGSSVRLPQYVSTGTASATIALTSVNGGAPPSGYSTVTTPLTSGSSACATVSSVLQCTVTVPAPPGADTFAVTLSDVNAHALSTNSETVTVAAGQTTTAPPLVLNGIAATYAIAPATDAVTTVHVSASGGGYRILGMLPYTFSFQPVDASGATIIGPGTPAVTVTSASNDLTATAVTGQSGSYSLKVVTQSTAAVSLTVQSIGGATVTVPITTSPEYFVCDSGTFSILAYDINGTTATLIPSDGLTFTNSVNLGGVAIDAAGHVWTSDENYGLRSYNPGSTTALTSIPVAGSWQLAFAPSGTLYAESYVSPHMYLKGFNASSGALLTTSSAVGATDGGPLAIDSLGQLWFGDEYQSNTVKGFTSAGTQIGALTVSTGNPQNALAFDASGHLWVGQNATMSAFNTSTGAIVAGSTITNNIYTPIAIRFDPAGDIIVLDNYQDTIHVYSPAGALLRTIPLNLSSYLNDMAIAP